MGLWGRWDEDEKAAAIRAAGLCAAVFAVFIFLSSASYLLHWQQDMSLQGDGIAGQAGNMAGKAGNSTGRFLVCELFGLGSFALVIIPAAISIKLLRRRWEGSVVKSVLISLFGASISALAFAFIGGLLSMDNVFGGGLGGRCGARAVAWAEEQTGAIVTGISIAVLFVILLIFSSKKFSRWLATVGEKKEKETKRREKETEESIRETSGTLPPDESEMPVTEAEPEPEEEEEGIPQEAQPSASVSAETAESKEEAEPKEQAAPEAGQAAEAGAGGSFTVVQANNLNTAVTQDLTPIDNRLDPPDGLPDYRFPSLDLLKSHANGRKEVSSEELTRNNNKIRATLANFKIQITDVKAIVGPTVTLYKVYPAPGVKIADIKKLQEDIALALNAKGVRVVVLSDAVGIEVANDHASIVPLKALLNDNEFRSSKADLPVAIGYTITQKVKVFDLADAPHLLVAGATKQGKSVGLNVIVTSLLYSKHPSELKFVFIDPKMVEFSVYSRLVKHYLAVLPDACSEEEEQDNAIVKKPKDAEKVLRSLCIEMDQRYELLSKSGVNNIRLYNEKYKSRRLNPEKGHRFLPYLVVVVDEYADLTMSQGASPETKAASRSITNSIVRLAQKGRAAGLHVILATQRPSVDVISGVIKSNFPMRIAFRVASRTDSMTILDSPGAEKLIGRGDMLFSASIDSERIQCALVDVDEEIDGITRFIGEQKGYGRSYNSPYYLPSVEDAASEGGEAGGGVDMHSLDERFEEAAKMVVTTQRGSTSDLQRKLGMGYAKAGRVMDQLEAAGIVGHQEGSKPRQVLVPDLNTLQPILDAFLKRG